MYNNKNLPLGIGLVAIGALLLFAQFGWVGEHIFMYLFAIGFFAAYKWAGGTKRYGNIGLLIPGSIILAIAIFADFERLSVELFFGPGWFFLLLGGAFLAVYQVHTRMAGTDAGSRQWPLYPAGGLAGFGLFVALVTQLEAWRHSPVINYAVPILFIIVGAVLLFRRSSKE